jgi:glycosyltransferase involved in cell wall biosynthesis
MKNDNQDQNSLTIAIPAYERPKQIVETLEILMRQWDPSIFFLIVDNSVSSDVEYAVRRLLGRLPRENWKYLKNRYNVGMSENFMRCFEHCETDWMWLLGDDDIPVEDAIVKIRSTLINYQEVVFVNFRCVSLEKENNLSPRYETLCVRGLTEFLKSIDHFARINFISVGVYNVKRLGPHFSTGHEFNNSMLNFLALVICALQTGGTAIFSKDCLIKNHDPNVGWSRVLYPLSASALMDLPVGGVDRALLQQLIRSTSFRFITVATIVIDQVRMGKLDPHFGLHLIEQTAVRLFYDSWSVRLKVPVYSMCINFKFLHRVLRVTPIIKTFLFNEKKS